MSPFEVDAPTLHRHDLIQNHFRSNLLGLPISAIQVGGGIYKHELVSEIYWAKNLNGQKWFMPSRSAHIFLP